jgi:hypothetical protein
MICGLFSGGGPKREYSKVCAFGAVLNKVYFSQWGGDPF